MTWQGWYTSGVIVVLVGVLISRKIGADIAFLSALALLLVAGILEPAEAVFGFANPAVITVGLLYVVAQGMKETGGMVTITRRLLGRPATLLTAQVRLLTPVAALSAFINNTPIVAMFLPVLSGWARRNNFNPSRLYMPLSFAAMLGGTCTLIGTSTNLVVNELIVEHIAFVPSTAEATLEPMGMFTLAKVGVPVLLVGLGFILIAGRWLLPVTEDQPAIADDPREYTTWMRVQPDSPLVGKTIEDAGLRHLSGLFLAGIERGDATLFSVGPEQILQAGDRLQFVGAVDSVVELQQMPGLTPNTEQISKLDEPRFRRRLIEAVVSEASPLVGKSVRAGQFRTRYNAVIIAVHRAGERIGGKIGDIVLRPGDTLLMEAPAGFARNHSNSSAFYLVSERSDTPTPRWGLAWLSVLLMAALVIAITTNLLDTMTAALCCAMLMVLTRCCTGTQARQSIDWQVLIVIGAAFGIAKAMENTAVAETASNLVLGWSASLGVYGMLAGVYFVTVVLTAVMTNNAAAALVFPIAFQFAIGNDMAFMPFAVCIAVGASTAFITPIGYQTNLMVQGPGGYSWWDFFRFGGPLTVVAGVVCVLLAPLMY